MHTNPLHLLTRLNQLTGENQDVLFLAEFFYELSLYDDDFYRFTPLLKASAAIYISRFFQNYGVAKKTNIWNSYLEKFTGLAYSDFKECLELLLKFCEREFLGHACKTLFAKYSLPQKNQVFIKLVKKMVIYFVYF